MHTKSEKRITKNIKQNKTQNKTTRHKQQNETTVAKHFLTQTSPLY